MSAHKQRPRRELPQAATLALGDPKHPVSRETADRAVEIFVKELGGRAAFFDMLEIAGSRSEVDVVLELLADPRYNAMSLATICRKAGLTVADLFSAFKVAKQVRGQIASANVVTAGIVPVVEDVMRRAAPYEEVCDRCKGTATYVPNPTKADPNPEPQPCPTCKATGRVLVLPELERQKVALDLAQLLPKPNGTSIIQQNLALNSGGGSHPSGGGALERMQQALAGINTSPLVLEAEVTDEPAAGEAHE